MSFPKPLMPLGDKPVLEVLMRRLIGFGVRDICLSLGHLAELVKALIALPEDFRVRLSSIEVTEISDVFWFPEKSVTRASIV